MISIPVIVAPWFTKLLVLVGIVLVSFTVLSVIITIYNFFESVRGERIKRRNKKFAKIAEKVYKKAEKDKAIAKKIQPSSWGLNLS